MKKILLIVGSLFATTQIYGAVLSTNILMANGAETNAWVVLTNRASANTIALYSTTVANVKLYDCAQWTTPAFGNKYTNGSYVSRGSFATNIVGSYVGANGYTNWTTNAGIFTYSVTNAAATNFLPVIAAYTVPANTLVTYPLDALFANGIAVQTDTNVIVTLYYNTGK